MERKEKLVMEAIEKLNKLYETNQKKGGNRREMETSVLRALRSISGSLKDDLTTQEQIASAIINGTQGAFFVFDQNLNIVGWNQRLEKVLKKSGDEIEGSFCLGNIPRDCWGNALRSIESIVSGERVYDTLDTFLLASDGTAIPHLLRGTLLSTEKGWYVFGFAQDTSAEKQSKEQADWYEELQGELLEIATILLASGGKHREEGLSEVIRRIANQMEMSGGVICTFGDSPGRFECLAEWSNKGASLRDYLDNPEHAGSVSSIYPDGLKEIVYIEDSEKNHATHTQLLPMLRQFQIRSMLYIPLADRGHVFGFFCVVSDRANRWLDARVEPLKVVGQLVANAVIRMDQENRLASREMEVGATLESSRDGILVLDQDSRVILANDRFADMWNLPATPDRNQTLDSLYEYFERHACKKSVKDFVTTNQRDSTSPREETWVLMDGRVLNVCGRPLTLNDEVRGTVLTFQNITEQRQLEAQLQQAQKLESIGRLASGVAHDFNNILFGISAICDVRLLKADRDDAFRKDIQEIKMEAERAVALTRQLLAFSRKQVLSIRTLDVNQVIRSMSSMLPRLLGEDIDLRFMLGANPMWVKADAHQLEQIIMNLAVNSRDAMPDGGRLIVETRQAVLDEPYCRRNPGVSPGSYVLIEVTDQGHGMSEETASQIFEPFFTTKGLGHGTGLGLAMVYGIVKQHGGHIAVRSKPDVGTSFEIYFAAQDEREESREKLSSVPPTMSSLRETGILVVEDERLPREMTSKMLEMNGHRVISVRSGEDALDLISKGLDGVDLLLTDMVLPKMSGRELASILQKRDPHMKVIYMSGHTGKGSTNNPQLEEGRNFLHKPFSMSAVLKLVNRLLNEVH